VSYIKRTADANTVEEIAVLY